MDLGLIYSLTPPPARATYAAHAETLRTVLFDPGSPRSLERWPVDAPAIAGKRQPLTLDIWSAAVGLFPDDDATELGLARIGDVNSDFARAIRQRLPAAREAWAQHRAAAKAKRERKAASTG